MAIITRLVGSKETTHHDVNVGLHAHYTNVFVISPYRLSTLLVVSIVLPTCDNLVS